MKTRILIWGLTLMMALVSLTGVTGCQSIIQLGDSPIPVTTYTDGK